MIEKTLNIASLGRIGVLLGGISSERDISLKSGKAVFETLKNAGCDVVALEINTTDEEQILAQLTEAKIDIAFLVLHGKFGEDGTIQTILEKAGISYTGSGPVASRLAMDKAATQILVKKAGVKVPDFFVLDQNNQNQALELLKGLKGFPVVVKPSSEGSSIGVTLVDSAEKFLPALKAAFAFGPQIVVDRYIQGQEVTCGVLGTQALPLVEIRPKNIFFDFTSKYEKGQSDYIVPAEIPAEQTRKIQEVSQKVFELIGCRDLARADFIVDKNKEAYFLEINTIPGFTATSLLPKAAGHQGINFTQLCLTIAGFASQRANLLKVQHG